MTDVRGFALSDAEDVLRSEGYKTVSVEVRSRKGVEDGYDKRVIRVRLVDSENTVYLAYSVFKTTVSENAPEDDSSGEGLA